MPTPAARAAASRLASAPPALKTPFAASRTRSRLRTASARGFRVLSVDCLIPTSNFQQGLKSGGILRISVETPCHTTPASRKRRRTRGAPSRRDSPSTIAAFGALHEHLNDIDRERREANDRDR